MDFSTSSFANRWLWRIVLAGVLLTPIVFSPYGKDSFRLPKEILFRLEVILVVSICAILFLTRRLQRPATWKDATLLIPAAAVVWSLISMLFATNHSVSLSAFLWILGWAVIFVVTTALAGTKPLASVYAMIVPAVINAFLVLSQEAELWNPFFTKKGLEHAYHSGFIGNANDVGTFLVAPTVAAFALIFVTTSNRVLHVSAVFLLVVAAVANHTLTALIAIVAGFLATIFVLSKTRAILAAAVAAILVIATVWFFPPLRTRYEFAIRFIKGGYYDSLLSGRLLPFRSAARMFADHPLLGVGPGCFKWEFFPYKLKVMRDSKVALTGETINYGEVHNDHLQILAETGLPGYALFVTALIAIASASFIKRDDGAEMSVEARFSRLASFPLVSSLAVLTLAQFPLELAAAMSVNIYAFALCRAWRANR